MLTRKQAINGNLFHSQSGKKCHNWRRNGQTKLWVTRPEEFRVPVKYGLNTYSYITHLELDYPNLHLAEDCPNA